MFWKGEVAWHVGEDLSSSGSCIEEKAEEDGGEGGRQGRIKK